MTKGRKNIFGFAFLFAVVALGFFVAFMKRKSLERHTAFTSGQIYELTTSSKSPDVIVRYKYRVEQEEHRGQNDLIGIRKVDYQCLYKLLLNRSFPVVYDNKDHGNSRIIISERDYKRFNIKSPDSLSAIFNVIDIDSLQAKSR